jgi:hypothetical protein
MATREPQVGREGPLLPECLLKDMSLLDSSQSQMKAQVVAMSGAGSAYVSASGVRPEQDRWPRGLGTSLGHTRDEKKQPLLPSWPIPGELVKEPGFA